MNTTALPCLRQPAADLRHRGFTLIELMIAVVVLALLASLAWPAYNAQIARSRRADAKQSLVELAQRMERYHSERGTYAGATIGANGIFPDSSRGGYYSLAITSQSADGFTLAAAPGGSQAGDACATFSYNHLGEQGVAAGATLSAAKCWQ
jgi:type IV pilus assembly protein PilE